MPFCYQKPAPVLSSQPDILLVESSQIGFLKHVYITGYRKVYAEGRTIIRFSLHTSVLEIDGQA
jgi:hypothetical protein